MLAGGGALAAATVTGVASARVPPSQMVPLIGPGYQPTDEDERGLWKLMDRVEAVARHCDVNGLFEGDEVLVSAGGSALYDLVAGRLKPALGAPVRGLLRSGCYVTHDHGNYKRLLASVAERCGFTETLQPALEVWAAVQSRPEPGLEPPQKGEAMEQEQPAFDQQHRLVGGARGRLDARQQAAASRPASVSVAASRSRQRRAPAPVPRWSKTITGDTLLPAPPARI